MNKQLAFALQPNPEARLDDFFWQDNTLVRQQLEKTLAGEGESFIYLWGPSGSGKSHLLQGCCHAFARAGTAMYLPLHALKEWGPASIEGMSNHALLAIDDIDAVAGQPQWEETLFHLYNQIAHNATTLLIANQSTPQACRIQMPDLRSRLASGLVLPLQELSDTDKIKTLQHQAHARGFDLPLPVASFLVQRCARNLHSLQDTLDILDKASLAAHRKVTIPFVKSILGI